MSDNVIWLDPDALETFVRGLKDWTDTARRSCTDVYNFNKNAPSAGSSEDGLVGEVNECTSVNSAFLTAVASLEEEAQGLKTRKDEAVAMNSEGIFTKNPDGMVCYWLPAGEDTPLAVRSNNSQWLESAKEDAEDFREAQENGRSKDGRTPKQILAEIKVRGRTSSLYSLAFCKTYGMDNVLDAPIEDQDDTGSLSVEGLKTDLGEELKDTFGHLLYSASEISEEPEVDYNLVGDIDKAVEDESGRASVLNAYLAETSDDIKGKGPSFTFNAKFLVNLADRMEEYSEWPDVGVAATPYHGIDNIPDDRLVGYTNDPLYGPLYAMGTNPDAAHDYFAPDSPGESVDGWMPSSRAQKRMEMLANRDWSYDNLPGLSHAFAAASSGRYPSPDAGVTNDNIRSTWVTARGLDMLENNIGSFTPEVKSDVGFMLGNSGPEVQAVANKSNFFYGTGEPYEVVPLDVARRHGADPDQDDFKNIVAHLLYEVCDSEEAVKSIALGNSVYTSERGAAKVEMSGGSEIKNVYDDLVNTTTALEDLAEKKSGNRAQIDNAVKWGFGAASLILGTGVPAFREVAAVLGGVSALPDNGVGHYSADTDPLVGDAYALAINSGQLGNKEEVVAALQDMNDHDEAPWAEFYMDGDEVNVRIVLDDKDKISSFRKWRSSGYGHYAPRGLEEIRSDAEDAYEDIDGGQAIDVEEFNGDKDDPAYKW